MSAAYRAGDDCQTCGEPFELCGHLQPETPDEDAEELLPWEDTAAAQEHKDIEGWAG